MGAELPCLPARHDRSATARGAINTALDSAGDVATRQHSQPSDTAAKGREEMNTGIRALKGQHAYEAVRLPSHWVCSRPRKSGT
jgi:hypothetical protein